MGVAGVVTLSRKWKSGPMTSRSPSYLGFPFPREIISHAVWPYYEIISHAVWPYYHAPQQAAEKMTEARQSQLSGAGFKPAQAAGIKSAGRERLGHIERDSRSVDQEDERK
jgi:hypothetical protein